MKIKSKNVADTFKIASKLAKLIKGGDIIFLNGDLGAGKTQFVKCFAQAIGIKENVTSPTFTLLKTYQSKHYTLVHVDAYRLDGLTFDELEDYISDENVIFIEWSSCLNYDSLLSNHLNINISYISKNQRYFEITATGKRFEELLKEMSTDA